MTVRNPWHDNIPQARHRRGGSSAFVTALLLIVAATVVAFYFITRPPVSRQPNADAPGAATATNASSSPTAAAGPAATASVPGNASSAAAGSPGAPKVPAVEIAEEPEVRATGTSGESARPAARGSVALFDAVTYTPTDRDVQPPKVLYSYWLVPPQRESQIATDVAIEVVVNEQGLVDSVRAVTQPRTLSESIRLTNGMSAVKAWRFQPATKDGHAVRYRMLIPLGNP